MAFKYPLFTTTIILAAVLATIRAIMAQTTNPTIIITWSTSNYTPAGYAGKDLPSSGSPVTAVLSLISAGKTIDISNEFISWYIDNNPIKNGKGLTAVTFQAGVGPLSLRAEIPNFARTGTFLTKTITIPSVSPQLVIKAQFPYRTFSASPVKLTAVPYFFNITDPSALAISWIANNGKETAENDDPYTLDLVVLPGTPPDYPVTVTASALPTGNVNAPGTSGGGTVSLIYQ